MRKPIYLDYSATTPVDPRVAQKMSDCLLTDGNFGNPASRSHVYGWQAEEAVEEARTQVAKLLNCDPREIVWTSGATESDNLAIKGVAEANGKSRRHIVTSVDRTQSRARHVRVPRNERLRSHVSATRSVRHHRTGAGRRRAAARHAAGVADAREQRNRRDQRHRGDRRGVSRRRRTVSRRRRAERGEGCGGPRADEGRPDVAVGAQDVRTERYRRAVRAALAAGTHRRRRYTAAATRTADVPARSPRIRSSAWAKRRAFCASAWTPRTRASRHCEIVCGRT